jgi:hypothetical protein
LTARRTFSQMGASSPALVTSSPVSTSPPAFIELLWHPAQYLSVSGLRCAAIASAQRGRSTAMRNTFAVLYHRTFATETLVSARRNS